MNNIDRFNECSAKLFAALYKAFPKPFDIDYFEWLGKEVFEAGDDELEFCDATVRWLDEAGYIQVKAYSNDSAYNVVLSAKGLEALKVVPDSLRGKGSIGDALVNAVNDGMMAAAQQIVVKALTESFKLFS